MFCVISGLTYSLISVKDRRPGGHGRISDQCHTRRGRTFTTFSNHVSDHTSHQSKERDDLSTMERTSVCQGSRVKKWSASFDTLLADPAGLHTFSEFLTTQFSHENIYFWVACRQYGGCAPAARPLLARQIYDNYLNLGSPMCVNLNAKLMRAIDEQSLADASETLFKEAESHVYQMMLMDCYPRFLQSPTYADCLFIEDNGEPLPYLGDESMDCNLQLPASNTIIAS